MKIKIKRAIYNVPTKSSSPYRNMDHADLANSLFPDNEVDLVTDDRENDCNTDEPFVNLNNVKGSGATELAGYFNQFEFTKRSSSTIEPKSKRKAPAKKRNMFKGKSFWANKKRKG